MKRNALSRIIAIIVSAQLMLAMVPMVAFAAVGNALQRQGASQEPLAVGTTDVLAAQSGGLPAGSYIVTVEPQGDSTCSYSNLRIWVLGEKDEVLYESYEVSPDPDSPWDPQEFSFTVSKAPKDIKIRTMWKNAEFDTTELTFTESFPSDYDEHPITAKAEGPGLDQPREAVVGRYYVECVEGSDAGCPLSYVDENGMPKQQDDWELLTEHEGMFLGGWFAVRGQVNLTSLAFLEGKNNLVLCDGAELNCDGGVLVLDSASLTIWSQRKGTGKLTATGQMNNYPQFNPLKPNIGYGDAGIGGYGEYKKACGDITINGGIIKAKGGPGAAGIGGAETYKSGTITINRGEVTATAGEKSASYGKGRAAGIGGGADTDSGPVIINGGKVTTEGHTGIGAGDEGDSGPITITGGTVYASSTDSSGAAIGGGFRGTNKGDITISGGFVWAETYNRTSSTSGECCSAAIGAGYDNAQKGAITISNGAFVVARSKGYGAGIGGGSDGTDVNAGQGNHNGGNITINDGVVYAQSYGSGAGIGGGNNGKGGNITINGGCVVAYGGQTENSWKHGSSHNIQPQSSDMSAQVVSLLAAQAEIPSMDSASDPINGFMDGYMYEVIADAVLDLMFSGSYGGAGIGGGDDGSGGTVTINGGVIEARGGKNSCSAIGWGDGGSKSVNLNIYDHCKVTYGELNKSGADAGLVNPSTLKVVNGAAQGAPKASGNAYALIEPDDCVITFDVAGHGTAPESQEIDGGGKVQEPIDPTADGYVFDGWYADKSYTERFDFNQSVYATKTIYGKWLKTYPLVIQKAWTTSAAPSGTVEMFYKNTWDNAGEGRWKDGQVILREKADEDAEGGWRKTIYVTEESVLELWEISNISGFASESWSIESSAAGESTENRPVPEGGYVKIDLSSADLKRLITKGDAVLTWTNADTKVFTVQKVWDIDRFKQYKPESIKAALQQKASGGWRTVETIELNYDNDWKGSFEPVLRNGDYRIRELDAKGNPVLAPGDEGASDNPEVVYPVTPEDGMAERPVKYQVAYEVDANGNTKITNSSGKRFHVKMNWNPHDASAPLPDSVEVDLEYDGGQNDWTRVWTLTLSAENNWEGDFSPVLDEGKYRVRERDENANKAVFVVGDGVASRKYEYDVSHSPNVTLSSANLYAESPAFEITNEVSGTIYSVTKRWEVAPAVTPGEEHGFFTVFAVLQHKEADGTWKTVGEVAESDIYQIILNLMEQVGGVEISKPSAWKAEFPAVPYGEGDDAYRVREVISDHVDAYGDGCLLGEGEGVEYAVREDKYQVKTLLAVYDDDNSSHELPSFTYRYHYNKWTQKSDWEAVFDVMYGRETGGGFTITNVERTHTVTFDCGDADGIEPQVVSHGQHAQRPANPVKEGMAFLGWQQVVDGKLVPHEFMFSTPITEDITLMAFFTDPDELGADRYTIATAEDAPVIDSDNMADVLDGVFTQKDFDENWTLVLISSPYDEDEVPQADKNALSASAENLGVKEGVWFDISLYKVLGDTSIKLTETSVPVELKATVPDFLRKDGRTFFVLAAHNGVATEVARGTGDVLNWSTSEFSTYLLAYTDEQQPAGNEQKPADNEQQPAPAATATLSFDANGGSGTMDSVTVAVGTSVELEANKFTRDGYTFDGWNTAKDGKGTAYADKAAVTLSEDTTLYAQWKANASTANGASSAKSSTAKTGDPLLQACLVCAVIAAAAMVVAFFSARRRKRSQ